VLTKGGEIGIGARPAAKSSRRSSDLTWASPRTLCWHLSGVVGCRWGVALRPL